MTAQLQVYQYKLPLLEAIPRGDAKNLWAEGLIVALRSEDGLVGFGELSEASLLDGQSLGVAAQQLVSGEADYAQVQWALSSARLNLELARKRINVATWMDCERVSTVPLNALLDASRKDFVDKGLNCDALGFRVLKIKVGDGDLTDEISRIRELLSILGKHIVIRLDANRKMPLAHAVEMVRSLKKATIEYFEEPFEELSDIAEFHRLTGVQVALDETVLTPEFSTWQAHEAVCAYVLKPSRIGSVEKVKNLIEISRAHRRKFIISSTFESGIGLLTLAQFASLKQHYNVAMGLATNSFFASDLISPPIRPFRGNLFVQASMNVVQTIKLDESSLCKPLF